MFPIWVKIADFGISKRVQDGAALETFIGTPGFMAPEIWDWDLGEYTNKVDVWSLGCVLYYLLTKTEPFPSHRPLSNYYKQKEKFPEDVLKAHNVSDAGIEFIKGLMAPAPESRTSVSDALNAPWIVDQSQSALLFSKYGWTALHYAAARDQETVVQLLLEKGANAAAKTHNGCTALHCAAAMGQQKVVLLLLENGADVTTRNNYGCTALHHAAWNGHEAVVSLLLAKGANVAAKSALLWTALHFAAEKGHEAVVRLLVGKGADVKATTCTGWTALHGAAVGGHENVVEILLEQGADIKATTCTGLTVLHGATRSRPAKS